MGFFDFLRRRSVPDAEMNRLERAADVLGTMVDEINRVPSTDPSRREAQHAQDVLGAVAAVPDEVMAARRQLTDGNQRLLAAVRGNGDGLQNALAGLGTQQDKRFFTQYTLDFAANRFVLEAMYMNSWLAGKIVGIPADDMTRERAELSWDGHDKDQADDKLIADEIERLDLWGCVNRALRWARLYGGSAIILGVRGEDMKKPLDLKNIKKGSLIRLIVKDRWFLSSSGLRDFDAESPNFGLPLMYTLSPGSTSVHWTRVIRFDGRIVPEQIWLANAYWHASELAHILDNIKDYDAGRAGVMSMLWGANGDILRLALLRETLSEDDGEATIQKRLRIAMQAWSMNRALVLDKEDEYSQKQINFAGIKDVLGNAILDVSGAADIPITRLFGQSPAGMTATGESDTRNYYDHIGSKRETQLRPPLTPIVQAVVRSAIGRLPENFAITFPPLWQASATEQATILKTNADRDKIYLDAGVVTEGLVARQLKSDNVYTTMEDDDVNMAEELAKALAEAPVLGAAGAAGTQPGKVPPGKAKAGGVAPALEEEDPQAAAKAAAAKAA